MFIQENTLISPLLLPLTRILKIFQICSSPIPRNEGKISFGVEPPVLRGGKCPSSHRSLHCLWSSWSSCVGTTLHTKFILTSCLSPPHYPHLPFLFSPLSLDSPTYQLSVWCAGSHWQLQPQENGDTFEGTKLFELRFSHRYGPYHPFAVISHPAILCKYYPCSKISVKYPSNSGAENFMSLSSHLSVPLLSLLFILFIELKSPLLFHSAPFARSYST